MNQTESLALLAAVALAGYWYGKRRAAATTTNTAASSGNLDWLGAWADA